MEQEQTSQQAIPPEEIAHLHSLLGMIDEELKEAQRSVEKMDEEYREAQQYMADRRGEDNTRDMFQSQMLLGQIDSQGASAVLYRDNDSALPLIDLLERAGTPYRCRQVESAFFTSRVVRDVTDVIRFALDPWDGERFLRLYYKLGAGISRSLAQEAADRADRERETILAYIGRQPGASPWTRRQCAALSTHLSNLLQERGDRAVYRIVHFMGYGAYLEEHGMDGSRADILEAIGANQPTPLALLERLETYDQVDYAMGLSNVEVMDGYMLTDALTPRQFAEMTDLDYELVCLVYAAYAAEGEEYGRVVGGLDDYTVPLMDMFFFAYDKVEEGYVDLDEEEQADLDALYEQLSDAREQLLGEDYTRMLVSLDLPEEGEETFAFLQTIHDEAERYYDAENVYLVGDSTSDYDLSVSFARDNVMISVLSVAFVIIVLLFTFQSVGLPLLLILVIQGSIWISFSFPGVTQQPIFFMSYLVVTSIQMGANIDYAIVISSWYNELKEKMPRSEAIVQALDLSFPTVLTSGSILSAAGFLISQITTEPAIVGIGECLCRGTLISMFLVMFILPQILYVGDKIVEKTRFNIKVPEVSHSASGTVYVNGRVRGRVSGVVDAHIQGVIYGDVSGMLETGSYQTKEVPKADETEKQ